MLAFIGVIGHHSVCGSAGRCANAGGCWTWALDRLPYGFPRRSRGECIGAEGHPS